MLSVSVVVASPGAVQVSVYVVCPWITFDVSPPTGEERPDHESPLVPVTVQLCALLTLHEIFVVLPGLTMLGVPKRFPLTTIGG